MKVECCNCKAILEFAEDYRDNRFVCNECGAKNAAMDIKFEPIIKFECYNCSKILTVDAKLAEQEMPCSACGMKLLIPKSKKRTDNRYKKYFKPKAKEIDGALIIPFVGTLLMVIIAVLLVCFGVRYTIIENQVNYMTLFVYLPYLILTGFSLVAFNKQLKITPILMLVNYFADVIMILVNAKMALMLHELTTSAVVVVATLVLWKIFWLGYFIVSNRVKETFIN